MKADQNKLQLKTKPLFKFRQQGKPDSLSADPTTATITITGQTILTSVMKR